MLKCPKCNGEGVLNLDTDSEYTCPRCKGFGFISEPGQPRPCIVDGPAVPPAEEKPHDN